GGDDQLASCQELTEFLGAVLHLDLPDCGSARAATASPRIEYARGGGQRLPSQRRHPAGHAHLMNETHSSFSSGGKTYVFHDVRAALGAEAHARLPYVARVLAENLLRNLGKPGVTQDVLRALADPHVAPDTIALPLHVPRVVVPDSSGIPVLMDLAALR